MSHLEKFQVSPEYFSINVGISDRSLSVSMPYCQSLPSVNPLNKALYRPSFVSLHSSETQVTPSLKLLNGLFISLAFEGVKKENIVSRFNLYKMVPCCVNMPFPARLRATGYLTAGDYHVVDRPKRSGDTDAG